MMHHTLLLLLLGHVLGDFVLQSGRLAQHKRERRSALLAHVGLVTLAHALCLLPGIEPRATSAHWLYLLAILGLVHWLIDAAKIAFERGRGESLRTFAADQALHVLSLTGVALLAVHLGAGIRLPAALPRVAILVIAYVLCTTAGSAVVRLVLVRHPLPPKAPATDDPPAEDRDDDGPDQARMGHTIGVLERTLGLTLILLDAWAGLGGIIAAKSIARFKALEQRHFGEYYLIGTLTSLLVTVAVAVPTTWLLARL